MKRFEFHSNSRGGDEIKDFNRFQQIFKHKNMDFLLLFSFISPCFTKYVPETLKSQLFHSFTFCSNISKTSYKRPYNTKFVKKYGIDKVHTPVDEVVRRIQNETFTKRNITIDVF